MSSEMVIDFEVVIGTPYSDNADRDLAIAYAAQVLAEAHSVLDVWRVRTYGDGESDSQIGVGLNVEVPEDEVIEFENAIGRVAETYEEI